MSDVVLANSWSDLDRVADAMNHVYQPKRPPYGIDKRSWYVAEAEESLRVNSKLVRELFDSMEDAPARIPHIDHARWKVFCSTRLKRGAGYCSSVHMKIAFSSVLIDHGSHVDIADTIQHEVAHAIVFYSDTGHHGPVWRLVAAILGARLDYVRYRSPDSILKAHIKEARYVMYCTGCEKPIDVLFRKPRRKNAEYSCKDCRSDVLRITKRKGEPWHDGLIPTKRA